MNITVYTTLSLVEIFVLVDSADASGNSLIASVSYNGVKYATTGDDVSRWAYTNDMNEINAFTDSLTYTGYNPDLWPFVDTTARCSAETAPSMNLDDVSYSELISANGITPQTDQYGGTTSHWIGVNGNDGECSAPSKVLYYLKLDLYSLAEEPTCFSQGDGRSFLGSTTPIMSFPSIGRKTATSSVLTFIGSAEGPYEVWGDGMGAVGLSSRC